MILLKYKGGAMMETMEVLRSIDKSLKEIVNILKGNESNKEKETEATMDIDKELEDLFKHLGCNVKVIKIDK